MVLVAQDPQLVAEVNTAADALPATAAAADSDAGAAADSEQQLQALLWELGLVLELRAALLQAYERHISAAAAAQHGRSSGSCSCGCCCADGSCGCCRFAARQLQHYSSSEVVLLVRAAQRLLATAVKAGCAATAAAVMPVAGLGLQDPEQLLTAAAAAAAGECLGGKWRGAQLSLLHLAVASQNARVVSGSIHAGWWGLGLALAWLVVLIMVLNSWQGNLSCCSSMLYGCAGTAGCSASHYQA